MESREPQHLTPRGATLMGLTFAAFGMFPILVALGLVAPEDTSAPAPPWILVCTGLFFIAGGMAIIINFAVAHGVGTDGELTSDTPLGVRVASLVTSLTIVGLLTAVFAWIAFGTGAREFSSTVSLPFVSHSTVDDSQPVGRTMFGGFAILFVLTFIVGGIAGVAKFRRARHDRF